MKRRWDEAHLLPHIRRVWWSENGMDVFDVVTGMLAGETAFAPHGRTVRIRVTR